MIRGIAILDYGPKTVTVLSPGRTRDYGTWSEAWGRDEAMKLLTKNGWRPAPGAEWTVSVPDNGRIIDVVRP